MAKKTKNVLTFKNPASWWGALWRDGLYVGNGKTGCAVCGGAADENIFINSAKLRWHGKTSVLPDVSLKFKDLLKCAENGDFSAAEEILPKALAAKNYRPAPTEPLPLCCLNVKTKIDKNIKDYQRTLDLQNGEAVVAFSDNGGRYYRSLFVSRFCDTVVLEMRKTGDKNINADLSLVIPFYDKGDCLPLPEGAECVFDKNYIYFSARNDNGLDYGAVAKVSVSGGTIKQHKNRLSLVNVSNALILVKVFADSQKDREFKKLKEQLEQVKEGYDKLKKSHCSLHTKQYDACELDLGYDDETCERLTEDAEENTVSAPLAEQLFNFGKYLAVSSCDEQNAFVCPWLFNGDFDSKTFVDLPKILDGCDFVFACNMSDSLLPVFDSLDKKIGDFKDNAMRLFGKHGIFVPHILAPNTGRIGRTDKFNVYDFSVTLKAALIYFRYYQQTNDLKFLKNRAYPFMKEAALFFEEFLVKDKDGLLHQPVGMACCPAEGARDNERPALGRDCIRDLDGIRLLFERLAKVCEILNEDENKAKKYREMAAAIPDYSDGELKTYAENTCNNKNAFVFSVFDRVFPWFDEKILSDEQKKAKYLSAAKEFLAKHSNMLDAFSLTKLGCVFACLGDTVSVKNCLDGVVKGSLSKNLSACSADWKGMGYLACDRLSKPDIFVNASLCCLLQNILIRDEGDKVFVLPSFPFGDVAVRFNDFKLRGDASINLSYSPKTQNLCFTIKSKSRRDFDVVLPDGIKKVVKVVSGSVDQRLKTVSAVNPTLPKGAEFNFKFQPAK